MDVNKNYKAEQNTQGKTDATVTQFLKAHNNFLQTRKKNREKFQRLQQSNRNHLQINSLAPLVLDTLPEPANKKAKTSTPR